MSLSHLTSLVNFPKLENLLRLDLNDNSISKGLENLASLKNIKHLELASNKIESLKDLEPLKNLKDLDTLVLDECPVQNVPDYRKKMFEMLENLLILDDKDQDGNSVEDDDEDIENFEEEDDYDEDEESHKSESKDKEYISDEEEEEELQKPVKQEIKKEIGKKVQKPEPAIAGKRKVSENSSDNDEFIGESEEGLEGDDDEDYEDIDSEEIDQKKKQPPKGILTKAQKRRK